MVAWMDEHLRSSDLRIRTVRSGPTLLSVEIIHGPRTVYFLMISVFKDRTSLNRIINMFWDKI